jgi:hypothetical protein
VNNIKNDLGDIVWAVTDRFDLAPNKKGFESSTETSVSIKYYELLK